MSEKGINFRCLRADEVDVRINNITEKGAVLVLYKNARCDMSILDETVGMERWQRCHQLIDNNLFCTVSIQFGENWVSKQDVGIDSYAEKEKGRASDSFKRACFNWGIGRELYTSPFIFVKGATKNDKFEVVEFECDFDKKIVVLKIADKKTKKIVFDYDIKQKNRMIEITKIAKEKNLTKEALKLLIMNTVNKTQNLTDSEIELVKEKLKEY